MVPKINCKQAVDLISRKEEGKLSRQQRFALWRHLVICSLCRMFASQSGIMARAARQPMHEAGLSEEEKASMVKQIIQR